MTKTTTHPFIGKEVTISSERTLMKDRQARGVYHLLDCCERACVLNSERLNRNCVSRMRDSIHQQEEGVGR